MSAPAAGDGDLRAQLAEALHAAFEWQYDQCSHGTYSGGPSHGQPYAMCDLFAGRLIGRVSRHADQRAAEELNSLANELHVLRFNGDDNPSHRWPTGTKREVDSFYGGIKRAYLRARARAARLDPQPTAPQEQP